MDIDTNQPPRHLSDAGPSVPQEILGIMVENLTDEASLSACSLASRDLLPICRAQRFRHLTFSNPSPTNRLYAYEKCLAFRELVTATPDLVGYTRILTLALERPLDNDPNLPWIIEHIDSLSTLELLPGCLQDIILWDDISPEVLQPLQAIFRSPSLQTLVIDSYEDVPIEVLRGATSLKRMSFPKTTWTPDPSAAPDFSSDGLASPISLKLLPLPWRSASNRTEMYLDQPDRLFSFKDLVELEVTWTEKINQSFSEGAFKPCLRSLQALGVEFSDAVIANLDLSPFISLRSFRASVAVLQVVAYSRSIRTRQTTTAADEFNALLASLKTLDVGSSKLDLVSINVIAHKREEVEQLRWAELDEAIARLHAAHPVQVTITLERETRRVPAAAANLPFDVEAIRDSVRAKLPLLDGLDILTI